MSTFSEVALNTEIALLIQIVFFGSIFGAITGIYHQVCKWGGDPRGPKGKTVVRGLCIVLVIVYGLAAIWRVKASDSRALWGAVTLGAGYGGAASAWYRSGVSWCSTPDRRQASSQ